MTEVNDSRDKFSNKIEYFLTSLSYAVGLGNVWRFPYLCYRNGGGSFFIPYLSSLVFIGFSFFFLESSLGQYSSEGPITVWKLSPLFQGVGIAMFIMGIYVGVYYNMVIAWALYFLYSTFTTLPDLPWSRCDNEWNTENCRSYHDDNNTIQSNTTNITKSPSDEFFHRHVLQMTNGIEDLGGMQSHLVICLAIAWILLFLAISRGVKSLGKVSYFTAIFPYIMITILLVKGATLDGAGDGVLYYVKPDWNRLTDIDVWSDAATQIFFSLSICMGGVITLASYNPFRNNCFKDSMIIVVCNSATSIYAGFAIFSVIGYMAKDLGQDIDKVVDQGVGLAFIAYPAALSLLPISPLWSCFFFLMIITLGFGSQITIIETIVVTIVDRWPQQLKHRKIWVLLAVCIVLFSAGLFMCSQAGIYILQLMDNYCVPYSALFIALFEIIIISWVYGINRLLKNIREMLGFYPFPRYYWIFMWNIGCPVIIAVILGLTFAYLKPIQYGEYTFPVYSEVIGWLLTLSSVIAIPVYSIVKLYKSELPLRKAFKALSAPTLDWDKNLMSDVNQKFDNLEEVVEEPNVKKLPEKILSESNGVKLIRKRSLSDSMGEIFEKNEEQTVEDNTEQTFYKNWGQTAEDNREQTVGKIEENIAQKISEEIIGKIGDEIVANEEQTIGEQIVESITETIVENIGEEVVEIGEQIVEK